MNDHQVKHLEMIETIIERMGKNSFQLKGWSVTLIAIIGGLSARESDKRFFVLAIVPILAFWMLDAYYLQIERRYKNLYRKVCNGKVGTFDLDIHDITAKKENDSSLSFFCCLFAVATGWFYIAIGGAVALLAWRLNVFNS